MEEKKIDEQIKDYIKEVCESGKYDIGFDEFDINVSFGVERHRSYPFILENVWDVTYETKLIEKDKKFNITVNGSVNPKYIAELAVLLYKKEKLKYEEKQQKEQEKESSKKSYFLGGLFNFKEVRK